LRAQGGAEGAAAKRWRDDATHRAGCDGGRAGNGTAEAADAAADGDAPFIVEAGAPALAARCAEIAAPSSATARA
jgi:hypothetical protein